MKLRTRIRRAYRELTGSGQNYTPEQLAEAGKTWDWRGSSYKAEQTAGDIGVARGLWQNNGYGAEAVNLLANSIIGKTGIIVHHEHEENREHWNNHWWNPVNRYEPHKEQQRRVMQNLAIDGEGFVRYHYDPESLFMEHIDALNIPHDNPETLGINRNQKGIPVSYQVRISKTDVVNVPAAQISHIYWGRFTSTLRGKSMLTRAVEPLTDLKTVTGDYKTAVRVLMAFRALVKYSQNAPDIPKTADGNGGPRKAHAHDPGGT